MRKLAMEQLADKAIDFSKTLVQYWDLALFFLYTFPFRFVAGVVVVDALLFYCFNANIACA